MIRLIKNPYPVTRSKPISVQWTGKKQPRPVNNISAQLTEIFDLQRSVTQPTHLSYSPLQKEWHNLLFQGDNNEVLDLLLSHGFREKIDFIYIDPPFNSGSEYIRNIRLRGNAGASHTALLQQTAYHDTWDTPTYLQFMYERLIKLKDLLKDTGFLCVHLDYHVGHYLKLVLDELFGQENFRNELIVKRVYKNLQGQFTEIKSLPQGHDVIYCYSKKQETRFKPVTVEKEHMTHPKGYWKEFWSGADRPTMRYPILGVTPTAGQWKWKKTRAQQAVDNYEEYQRDHASDNISLCTFWTQTGCGKEFIRKSPSGRIEHWVPPSAHKFLDTVWSDIASYSFDHGFGTEKSEELLERLLSAFSKPDDLVLDAFTGSGTTVRAAQRLGRRWIACDVHPTAIQLTSRLLQQIIGEQLRISTTMYPTFMTYRVNAQQRSKKRNHARRAPVEATITVERNDKKTVCVKIDTFHSSTLLRSLGIGKKLLKEKIPDFRCMIDSVLIDPDYDGAVFHVTLADAPSKKDTLVKGMYDISVPCLHNTIAVKIIAVTGEETVMVKYV